MQLYFVYIVLYISYQKCSLILVEGHCPTNTQNGPKSRFAVFERKETGKALINHVFLSRIVRSEIECSLTCLRHAQCESYNYQNEGERHVCELSNQTRLTRTHDLVQRDGFSYFSSGMQPCLDVICHNGGTCHPSFVSPTVPYCCQCEQGYQGDHCQNFMGFRFTKKVSGDYASLQVKENTGINTLSVCLRFKATEVNYGDSTPLSYVTNGTAVVLQILLNRTVRVIIKDQCSDFTYVSLLDNTWHHVCITWESIVGNLSLYIDGLLIGQKQDIQPGLIFNSSGTLVIGQLQKTFGGNFVLNDSFLGDITDVNLWSYMSTQSIIMERSRVCYEHVGNLLAWPTSSTEFLRFPNEEVSIPTECKGFDLSTTYDLEFPRRTNEDYVFLEWPTFPALAAFTVTFFVSFTDPGDKTFISYFAEGAMNELFIHERNKRFTVWIHKVFRSHGFQISPDGLWHHVAVTWENVYGNYEIFVNGEVRETGQGLQNGTRIIPGGNVVVGNDKDLIGYQARDAYVGNISRVNIWDYVLPRETIALLSQRCGQEKGETVSWRDFRAGSFQGVVHLREPSSCQRQK